MKTVLFFISLMRNSFREQLEGVYRYARDHGWHVQVVENPMSRRQVREALAAWQPVGVMVEYGDRAVFHDRRLFGRTPVVYFDIGRRKPSVRPFVSFDSSAAGRMGAEHLLSLGLSQYAYVGYFHSRQWDRERGDAFCAAVRKAGVSCVRFSADDETTLQDRSGRLLGWLKGIPRPCGIMAANDRVAEEVVNACHRLKLRMPEDVAVLGVDNDVQLCENLVPTLSSVVPDIVGEGLCAARILDRLISADGSAATESRRMPPLNLVVRQSTRLTACDKKSVGAALEMIRRQATEGIGVGDVVAAMGEKSRRMAERHFRAATGRGIHEEILAARFEKVYELLRRSSCDLGSIAGRTGFRTEVALRKAFRLREGCSMRTWRERHT